MTSKRALDITIGAALDGFQSITKGTKQIDKLGSAIKKMQADSKRFESFGKMKTATISAKNAWQEAQQKVKELSQEIRTTDEPSKKLIANFEKAKTAAKRAKDGYFKQRNSLHQLRGEMQAAGQDVSQLSAKNRKLGSSLKQLRGQYDSLNRSLRKRDGILQQRAAIRGQLFDTVALAAAVGAPIKVAADLESAMADVRKVMTFSEPDGLKKLEQRLKEMSREIPVSAEGLAQIAAAGGQMKIGEDDIEDFTRVVAKMSTAFNMTPEEAGDAMAKLSNVYDIPISQMEKLGDVINHISDNSASKAHEIVPVLARIGGTAQTFGLSAKQSAALASSFIALGKSPQIAATAINGMLMKLDGSRVQGKKFHQALREMGMDAESLKQAISEDAEGALTSFLERVAQIDKQDRTDILVNLFGLEYADDISVLANGLEKTYKQTQKLVQTEAEFSGSMHREFMNRSDTTVNKWQLFKNALSELSTSGSSVLKPIKMLLGAGASLLILFAKIAGAIWPVTGFIFALTIGLVGLKIAHIAVAYSTNFLKGGLETLKIIYKKLRIQVLLSRLGLLKYNKATIITAIKTKALAFSQKLLAISFGVVRKAALLMVFSFGKLKQATILASMSLIKMGKILSITSLRMKAVAVGGWIASFSGALLGLALKVIPIVAGGIKALTVAIMTNPIGLIVGGIAIAAGLLITNWGKVKGFFLRFWTAIQPIWQRFFKWVMKAIGFILSPLKAIGKVWSYLFGEKKQMNVNAKAEQHNKTFKDAANGIAQRHNMVKSQTINQQVKINLQTHPGQDSKQIAENVMRELKTKSRGAMFDLVGEPT